VNQVEVVKGFRPQYRKASPTYSKGRVCGAPGCEVKLSQYNRNEKCWAHLGLKVPRLRGRVPSGAKA